MIYKGFNQREINKISEILDRHGVQYQVGVPNEAMDHINDKTKRVNHRFMDNLLQIEIETSEFDKIPTLDINKLFDLRIYREEESPFTEEELAAAGTDTAEIKPAPTSKEHATINKWSAIFAVGLMALFFLWKNGFLK